MRDGGKGERIDKLLSNRGVGSRTQVGKLIRKGRVSAEGVGIIK
jgi:16S rRNA U516 pseudouridylate synthase RsuA-like enzyme